MLPPGSKKRVQKNGLKTAFLDTLVVSGRFALTFTEERMPLWLYLFIILAGGLFAFKLTYILCTAAVLPITRGALYVSTSGVRVSAFMDAVRMESGQVLVDLGCGDGRVLRTARKRYKANCIGYELNLLAYLRARLRCLGMKGVDIRLSSFWKADLADADVVFCYLFPDVMKDLSAKLTSSLKPGAVVVSCNFPLPGFKSRRILRPGNSLHNDPIYIYRMDDQA